MSSRRFIKLPVEHPLQLQRLSGTLSDHLHLIEARLEVRIQMRGDEVALFGPKSTVNAAEVLLTELNELARTQEITLDDLHLQLNPAQITQTMPQHTPFSIKTPKHHLQTKGDNQARYIQQIRDNTINFGTGPAGTGKTWLAVACAVEALVSEEVERIILARPAVEAGERLGFLPGDLRDKIDPYLRPLYDALYTMLGNEKVDKLIEDNTIELAPLAYMRGRTLNHAFVILDEGQNTTIEQMKMFLTRIGFGSRAIITGDTTQIDLPRGQASGLIHALSVLDNVDDIGMTHFSHKDVVRHPLVARIIEAYEAADD